MYITDVSYEKIKEYRQNLSNYIDKNFTLKNTLYLDLGVKTVRLLIYNEEFIPHIERQMEFVLRKEAKSFDAAIVLWKEPEVRKLYKIITPEFDLKTNLRRRIELLGSRKKTNEDELFVLDKNYSKINPVISISFFNDIANCIDTENNTYYYGVTRLDAEEFIKEGHIFVQNLNRILKTDSSNIAHGAVCGFNNNGVLFCARGQRGKSTLSVLSMVRGFEYVSDDYFTLQKEGDNLYSYPIYSIITLSPEMYNRLYSDLKDCNFVSNNARKDKYVFNISNFHSQFKVKYPINLCIFPEIVSDKEPSITPCTIEEKGRAIVQLVHSTTMQMQDMADTKTVKKLFNMVKDFEFLKLNLCFDIEKNTIFLKEYLKTYKSKNDIVEFPVLIEDITYDIASIINTKTFAIYATNRFGTMLYQNLKRGVTKDNILKELAQIENVSDKIKTGIDNLLNNLLKEGIIEDYKPDEAIKPEINIEFIKEDNYYPWFAKFQDDEMMELIKQGV